MGTSALKSSWWKRFKCRMHCILPYRTEYNLLGPEWRVVCHTCGAVHEVGRR